MPGVNSTQSSANTYDTTALATDYIVNSNSHSETPNYGINALYNHRFNSHGRNFSVNVGVGRSSNDQYQNPNYTYNYGTPTAPLTQFITTNSKTDTVGTSVSFIEPISRRSYVELNYNYKNSNTTSDKLTDTLASSGQINEYPLLSNNYSFSFITNRVGINYRFVEKKYNYVLGVTAQPSVLDGSSPESAPTHVNNFNFSPNAHFIYNFSRTQSFSANFSGSSVSPTYTQLQPVADFSNALYPVIGNPDLKQQYNNTLSFRYNKFNFQSGNVYCMNISFIQYDNSIVANTTYYNKVYAPNGQPSKLAGTIATCYQNTDGYYSTQAFYVFAKPWDKRKYNLFFDR